MNSALTSSVLLASLIVMVLLGRRLRPRLPDEHLSSDSRDAVKLAMGLVATMTALLLGLLVSSAKGSYDTQRTEVILMASKVTFISHVLTAYGPEAAPARAEIRGLVADAVRQMWPENAHARPVLVPNAPAGERIYAAIQGLNPRDDAQRGLKAQAATLSVDLAQLRTLLQAQAVPSIPKPLLIMVSCWLVIIFFCFSLLAPPNATTGLALVSAAVSAASAVFLIMELDAPLGGLIRISSEPMQNALNQFAK